MSDPLADIAGCVASTGFAFVQAPAMRTALGVANLAETKLFAQFLFKAPGYIEQLHAAPGHILPVLKTIAEDPAYLANPIIKKYTPEVKLMAEAARMAPGFAPKSLLDAGKKFVAPN